MKNKWWILTKKTKDLGYSYEVKERLRYFKGSTIAILLGLVAACVIVGIQNVNPFSYLVNLIGISFSPLYVNQTMQWISIYIIAGLAIAISFKSGSFNIGVAGQMMIGAGLSIIFIKGLGIENPNFGHIIVMLLITVVSGALLAGFAGFLKATFNIHEVVTTIMLNWIVWYLFKYIFTTFQATLGGEGVSTSASIPPDLLTVGSSPIFIPLLIAILALIFVALLLNKTVFGFKIKAVGVSVDASKYAGYNVKQKIIQAMAISGALAGLASFVNITTITPNLSFSVDNLPSLGYDSIAVSLVAFNNPVGIFFTSFLWGTLQSSGSSAASLFGIAPQLSALIFGVIVYFAAISVVFMNYYPLMKLRISLAVMHSRKNREKIRELSKEQMKSRVRLAKIGQEKAVLNYKQDFMINKNQAVANYERSARTAADRQKLNKTLNYLKYDLKSFMKEYRQNLKSQIAKLDLEIAQLKKSTYLEQINHAKSGIERRHFAHIRQLETDGLQQAMEFRNERLLKNDDLKFKKKSHLNYAKIETKKAKENYEKALKSNLYWYEGQYGDLTNYYLMLNTKIENKGDIKKQEILMKNQISSLKADYHFTKSQAILNKENFEFAKELTKLKNQITQLKLAFKKLKLEKNEEIAKNNKLYHSTLAALKKTSQLKDLKIEYGTLNQAAKNEYKNTLMLIKQNQGLIKHRYDDVLSEQQFNQVSKIVDIYFDKYSHEVNQLVKAEQQVSELEKLFIKVKKVYHQPFNDLDSPHYVNKKVKLFSKLNKELERVKTQVLILKVENETKQAVLENHQLLKAYDNQVTKINQEYKFQVKAIKRDSSLRTYERNEQLIAQEDFFNEEIDSLVNNLEAQYLTKLEGQVS